MLNSAFRFFFPFLAGNVVSFINQKAIAWIKHIPNTDNSSLREKTYNFLRNFPYNSAVALLDQVFNLSMPLEKTNVVNSIDLLLITMKDLEIHGWSEYVLKK